MYTPIVKFIHLFPTFLELEHGLAPSTAEMEVFNECDVPINFCYPQYFYTNYGPEEAVIAAAEAFHERHCFKGKRRSPSAQHFDLECLKNPELDLSIFGDLQWEIREFMNRPANEKGSDSNDEDFVDADEDLVENEAVDLNLPAEQRRALNSNGEETVNVLKRDLMVMEDIMKDINKICKIEAPYGGNSGDDREFILFEQLQGDDPGDFYSLKEELRDEEAHFTGNESIVSVDDANSTVIKRESLNTNGDLGSQAELSKHPLSAIVFDLPSEDENLCEISGYERKDRQLYTRNLIKEERKSGRSSDDELFIDVESNDREKTVDNIALLSQDKIVNCTNPFLRDLDATARAETDCVIKLHPNNPFLSYLQEDDKSSTASSTSTAYDSPVIATTQHSWTSFSDMSAETISLLGRSLRSNSSSSESLKTSNDHHSCSTQTADTQNRAVQVAEPYFCPARSQPPQGYPPWWAGGGGNPYYNVRFANFLSYTCEPQYGPRPPPPPGFFPQSRFPPVGGFPNMQYGLQRPPWEQSGPNSVRMPYLPPRFNPTNSQGANNAACLPGSVSSDCVSTVRENRDFYELYNEELRLRMNYNGGQ